MRKLLFGLLAATALTAAGHAQTPPLRIGMEEDLSTSMASVYGKGAVVAAEMAVEDWGPEVIGRKIELITGDGQSKPDVATALVREWFDKQDVQMVTGLSNSAIGLAVQAMAREKDRISIITGVRRAGDHRVAMLAERAATWAATWSTRPSRRASSA